MRIDQSDTAPVLKRPRLQDVGPPPTVSSGRLQWANARLHGLRAAFGASPWTSLLGRVVLFAVALLVLAWIGRVATAATPTTTLHQETQALDGGELTAPTASGAPPPPVLASAGIVAESQPPAGPAVPSSHARATVEDPVYVNHASAEELRRLPGVGPKRAQAIVALRQRVGRFQRVEDLLRVKGVGRATIRKWRPLLRLDAPPNPIVDAGPP